MASIPRNAPVAAPQTKAQSAARLIRNATAKASRQGLRNVRFAVGAGKELPLDDGAFDVVILSWTL